MTQVCRSIFQHHGAGIQIFLQGQAAAFTDTSEAAVPGGAMGGAEGFQAWGRPQFYGWLMAWKIPSING